MAVAAPIPLFSLPYLGSPYKHQAREKLPLESNETASFIPSLFFDTNKNKPSKESVQKLFYKVMPTLHFQGDVPLMEQLKVDIMDHAENRLQLFFQQLLMVFKTNIAFSYSKNAQLQAGLKHESACPIPLAEAHSSTLPCLLFTRDETQYVFGAGTSFYHAQNMTVKLPEATNKVDTWIDSSNKDFGGIRLRDIAGCLIQGVSRSGMNPLSAFQIFIQAFSDRLDMFKNDHKDDKKMLTCQFYQIVATSYKTQLVANDVLVKSLCFERKSTETVDETFILKVQERLHISLRADLRVAEQREKLFFAKHLTNTQQIYAKIYLNAPELTLLLGHYFSTTHVLQLEADWKNIVQVKPSANREGISADLNAIITKSLELIKNTYKISSVKMLGAIMESILYQASISLNPAVNALYTQPEVANRGPVTRSAEKPVEYTPPLGSSGPCLVIYES